MLDGAGQEGTRAGDQGTGDASHGLTTWRLASGQARIQATPSTAKEFLKETYGGDQIRVWCPRSC
jgi:hypothetical protein